MYYMLLKDRMFAFRLSSETFDALDRAAKSEQRPRSNLAGKIVRDWLIEHRYLKQKAPPKKKGRKE